MSNVIQFPVIAGIDIHTDGEGRFNLNALHKAHLKLNQELHKNSKQPADWLRLEGTKELIDELFNSEDSHSPLIVAKQGRYGGTFVHELLAVSYAGWISPKFQLNVNQEFLNYKNGILAPVQKPAQLSRFEILRIAMDAEQENQRLAIQLDEQKPKVEALERLSGAVGNMCITDAAKQLQVAPRKLFSLLNKHQWIYKRPGNRHWVAYQPKIQQGLIRHNTYTIKQPDAFEGFDRFVQQVQITPKGLARLAELLSNEAAA
ncbi:MAG: phage antirepressor KilAC domain-containing protein [Pseudomonadales bacterium]|nr:phage antirepressor KilAC domain-containing protein [Pseudomonadales bacterium]NRA15223.1 phage antirepressor KilAC domain-containing protein [Oceanospirillaceae bacterium]